MLLWLIARILCQQNFRSTKRSIQCALYIIPMRIPSRYFKRYADPDILSFQALFVKGNFIISSSTSMHTRWHFDMEFLEAFMVLDNRVLRFMLWIIKVFLPWFIAISSGILKRTLTFVLRSYEFIHPQYQLLNLTPLILFQIIYFYCSFVLSGYMHANFGFMIIYEIVVPCTFLP